MICNNSRFQVVFWFFHKSWFEKIRIFEAVSVFDRHRDFKIVFKSISTKNILQRWRAGFVRLDKDDVVDWFQTSRLRWFRNRKGGLDRDFFAVVSRVKLGRRSSWKNLMTIKDSPKEIDEMLILVKPDKKSKNPLHPKTPLTLICDRSSYELNTRNPFHQKWPFYDPRSKIVVEWEPRFWPNYKFLAKDF